MTSTEAPLSCAIATISAISAVASAVERPTLERLCPSAADTTYSIDSQARRDRALGAVRAGDQRGELDAWVELMQFGGEFGGVGQRGHLRR